MRLADQCARFARFAPVLSALLAATSHAYAAYGGPLASGPEAGPALLCRGAIAATEAATRIPDAFLAAIGRVESGRMLQNGMTAPWPWTVNAAGVGHFYASKADALAAVRAFQAGGTRSLDIGCLQVNIMYHPDAFASPEQAFDPATNVAYAARLLMSLHAQTGSWPRAAAAYHSQTPSLGQAYQERVLAEWAEPDSAAAQGKRSALAVPPGSTRARDVPPASSRARDVPPTVASVAAPSIAALPSGATFTPNARLPAASGMVGRSLAAYRAMPVQMAARAPITAFMRY